MAKATATLASLINERLRPAADTADVDRRIEALFGEEWCVVFSDMEGFSRRAARTGIIPFLALIHQMNRLCRPIIKHHAGFVLKRIADSYLILFRDPRVALGACVEMQLALARYNDQADERDHIHVGFGIGHGRVLKIGAEDVFGMEVNLAAKLGEDIAGAQEILLTRAAALAIGTVPFARLRRVRGSKLLGSRAGYYEAVYLSTR